MKPRVACWLLFTKWIFFVTLIISVIILFSLEIFVISDLHEFELPYIISLFGWTGIILVALLNAGFFIIIWRIFRNGSVLSHKLFGINIFLAIWLLIMLWFVDWMFVPDPFSLKLRLLFADNVNVSSYAPKTDVQTLTAFIENRKLAFPNRLGVILDRIVVNNPPLYGPNGPGPTILKYSKQYDVDPTLLLCLNYIESWYGKGPAGPMPFFNRMTAQTVRKFVQVHLPSIVVESGLRVYLASSNFYARLLGNNFTAWQLREFAHKFTLDASVPPYALNIFSDVLLVMKEYPEDFPELRADFPGDSLSEALRESFEAIKEMTLRKPYEEPYLNPPYDGSYYGIYRGNLRRFARAVFYKMTFDFDFATKVQALLIKYDSQILRQTINDRVWDIVDNKQKQAMLAMSRDMFTPNVGRLGDNLYTLCEINCTPIVFIAQNAKRDLNKFKNLSSIWRPTEVREPRELYAGANYRLRVFSEVWQAFYGEGLPGVNPTDTVSEALRIVQ